MKDIKPKTITHLSCLITGDRFYFTKDGKREVWELRFHTQRKVNGQMKKFSKCNKDSGEYDYFDSNRVVTFLRRTYITKPRSTEFFIEKYFA